MQFPTPTATSFPGSFLLWKEPGNEVAPTVEECDFDRQFLYDEYVAISHRYDLKRVSLKS
jgi:hypothetical protein